MTGSSLPDKAEPSVVAAKAARLSRLRRVLFALGAIQAITVIVLSVTFTAYPQVFYGALAVAVLNLCTMTLIYQRFRRLGGRVAGDETLFNGDERKFK